MFVCVTERASVSNVLHFGEKFDTKRRRDCLRDAVVRAVLWLDKHVELNGS